jgi:hypothetical protein
VQVAKTIFLRISKDVRLSSATRAARKNHLETLSGMLVSIEVFSGYLQ